MVLKIDVLSVRFIDFQHTVVGCVECRVQGGSTVLMRGGKVTNSHFF